MANIQAVRPVKHTIDLGDGVEREIEFSLNAMADLEEKYGTIEQAFEKVQGDNISAIRFLLWCLLNNGEQEISEREIGRLINLRNLSDLMSSVMDYMEEAMPGITEMAEKNPVSQTWQDFQIRSILKTPGIGLLSYTQE